MMRTKLRKCSNNIDNQHSSQNNEIIKEQIKVLLQSNNEDSIHSRKNSINDASSNFLKFLSRTPKVKDSKDNVSKITSHKSLLRFGYDNSTNKNEVNNIEYKKLQDKMAYLSNKISLMSHNIDKKRQIKKHFLQKQKQNKPFQQQKQVQEHTINSLHKYVTQIKQNKQFKIFNSNPYTPKNSVYYITSVLKAYREFHEEKSQCFSHIMSSIQFLKMLQYRKFPQFNELTPRLLHLEQKNIYKKRKSVILDLDETLVHCNQDISMAYDVKISIKLAVGQCVEAGIKVRPYVREFLQALSLNFQIIVFTASHRNYATQVVSHLDPKHQYIQHILSREHCYCTANGIHIKDLRIIDRHLSQIVLVDNASYSYSLQIDNGIPIIPYYQGNNDYELYALKNYIESLKDVDDVRKVNRQTFKLHKYVEFDNPSQLVRTLYMKKLH